MIDVLLNAAAHQPTVRDALDKYLGERRDVEQPVDAWAADLHAAGFATVHHRQVHPYWWAPAHLIVATA